MTKLCSTDDLMGQDEREILVWHHRLNHFSFKSLIRLSKMGMIPRNISKTRNPLPCVDFIFGNFHKRPSQIPANLEEVYRYVIGDNLTREDISKLWSTKDLLGQYKR